MRKLMVLVLALALYPGKSLHAQYYYENNRYYASAFTVEVGGAFGIMNALTDLGGRKGVGKKFIKDLNWKNSKPSAGFYIEGTYQDAIGVRLEGTFGTVQAYDSILKSVKTTTFGRYERNLSFRSKITDIQLAVEVHPLFFKPREGEDPPRISPYAVLGVGYFSFDPKAYLKGQWYSLQPLHTEGQGSETYPDRKPYKLNQLNVAAGGGIRYELNSMFNARLEFVHRFLNTDYLDDVSTTYVDPSTFSTLPANQAAIATQLFDRQAELDPTHTTDVNNIRGNPKNNDAFFTIELKIGVIIGRQKR